MLFGLFDASVILQHLMNDIFRKFLDDFVVCYLDDILIFSKNLEEHKCHIEKCVFYQPQVEFLGYIISNEGLMMDLKKIQAATDWSIPKIVRDVQCFFVFANFYRIFIKNYSQVAAPLTQLTYKDKLEWGPEAQKSF
jgi:hypothetical protein